MPIIDKFHNRPEIDGLRAVAVLAVVLYHAGFSCTGGYVGVDVFFIISGFLITSLIWKDLESGCFTFANFWERRARRIVPALVVVTIAILVAGWFLLLPSDFKSMGQASAAQAVFAANIHYWRDTGYFLGAAAEKPLLHTWSLAVEEQFYLIVPFLLWVIFRSVVLRNRTTVISILTAGFILSFGLSIYGIAHFPSATYYLLPTRAWELLLGSLIAFLPIFPLLLGHRSLRELLSLAGLALILLSVIGYTPETPFPGLAALPPCLGAALLIWSNGYAPTVVGSLLSTRPFVFIGLISYSLYLWHWPFLAFSKYLALESLSIGSRAAIVSFGFLFAIFSWKYVETPFRKRELGQSRKSMFALAGASLAVVLVCGLLCVNMNGFPLRFSMQRREFVNAITDMAFINELNSQDIRAGKAIPIGVMDSTIHPTVFVWGDSHAMAALPALDTFLKERGFSGRAATHSATAPVLDWHFINNYGVSDDSISFNNSVFSYIQKHRIPDVILIARWSSYVRNDREKSKTFVSSLLATVRRLAAVGSRPWILLDVPNQTFSVPKALSSPLYSQKYIASLCAKPTTWNELEVSDPKIIAEIEVAGGRILDPKPRFLDPTGQYYIIQANGVALYRDEAHLTAKGAKIMLLPFLRDSFTLQRSAILHLPADHASLR